MLQLKKTKELTTLLWFYSNNNKKISNKQKESQQINNPVEHSNHNSENHPFS